MIIKNVAYKKNVIWMQPDAMTLDFFLISLKSTDDNRQNVT